MMAAIDTGALSTATHASDISADEVLTEAERGEREARFERGLGLIYRAIAHLILIVVAIAGLGTALWNFLEIPFGG